MYSNAETFLREDTHKVIENTLGACKILKKFLFPLTFETGALIIKLNNINGPFVLYILGTSSWYKAKENPLLILDLLLDFAINPELDGIMVFVGA